MTTQIPIEQIEIESRPGYRPPVIDTGITVLPLSALGDRDFELLAFLLVKEEISSGRHPSFDSIALMQGVAERGRDCVLYKDGVVSGLIQCKKYAGRLTRPQVLKELIKFTLFATLDTAILPDPKVFEYKLFVSNDLTEPAIALLHSYRSEIEADITAGTVDQYLEELVEEYESFSVYKTQLPKQRVQDILRSLKITSSNATELSSRIYNFPDVLTKFFSVRTIVSIEDADRVVRTALDDYGLKLLTDQDLKLIQRRIDDTTANQRANFGIVDFFGFSSAFFRYIRGDNLKSILHLAAQLRTTLDQCLMEFIQSQITSKVLAEITNPFVNTGRIHQFSVNIASPYLFKRLTPSIVGANLPRELAAKLFPDFDTPKDKLLKDISEQLFDTSAKIMRGDYSGLVGDPEIVRFKIQIYQHIHQGFSTVEDIRQRFAIDIELLKPVLDRIEQELGSMFSDTRTIIVKDSSFFANKDELDMVQKTIRAIDVSNPNPSVM